MRKPLLVIFCCISLHCYSQVAISGVVIDTSENKPLANAVIQLIRQSDSIQVQFTRTKVDGSFHLKSLSSQKYILLITYPKYADYVDVITTENSAIDIGRVALTQKSQLLETVIVSQKFAAIRMKGDTIEYRADSFATRQGASVEELLKKLPGIQVDKNGRITAQGQKVNKILVDGEEFFSDDPAVVTRNLPADAVKEVQVFDKKSDQAVFTGIDDGKRSKTINLTLKADRKKGYFGKVEAGGGSGESYDNNAMFNAFKGTRKFSVFGIMSNTGREGLSWEERDKYGGSNDNVQFDEENGYFVYTGNENSEFNDNIAPGEGLPSAWSAGVHYSNKWNKDVHQVNADYKFIKRDLRNDGVTISEYILPDTQYFKNENSSAFNNKLRHFANGTYNFKADSSSSFKLKVAGYHNEISNGTVYNSVSRNQDSALINSNDRRFGVASLKGGESASLAWKKKFVKKGRTISVNVEQETNSGNDHGILKSLSNFYNKSGIITDSEVVDQQKINKSSSSAVRATVIYTEPLSRITFLSFNYNFQKTDNEANRNTFNHAINGTVYNVKDSAFSSDFLFGYNSNKVGATFKLNKKKFVMSVGSGTGYSQYSQKDLVKDSINRYGYVNFFPTASLRYVPHTGKEISFQYNGSNNAPQLEQIQPLRENSDPLNIRIGNPALRQEFAHNANFNYYNFKVMGGSYIYAYGFATLNTNAISTSTNISKEGKTTLQFINVPNNSDEGGALGFGKRMEKQKADFSINIDLNSQRNANRINGLDNVNNSYAYSAGVNGSKWEDEKYLIHLSSKLSFNYGKSSLRKDVPIKYYSNETELNLWFKMWWKLEFNLDSKINLRQKTDAFDVNRNVSKIDLHLRKKFGKSNNGEIQFSCFDLLDQNIGFRRSINTNIISENSYSSLRRYFMLSAIFSFSKTPK